MNPKRIISDFKQRTLHIDFLEMSLMQNKPAKEAISYKGKGYIQQMDDDVLAFRLYASETRNTDPATDFNRLNKIKSGEFYSDDSYYTLNGIAADGAAWKAEQVLPTCDWHVQHANPVVHGKLSSITGGEMLPAPKTIAMYFFEKANLLVGNQEVKFAAAGCELHVECGDDSFVVRAKSDASLPEHFAMRVEEALRFPCLQHSQLGAESRNTCARNLGQSLVSQVGNDTE